MAIVPKGQKYINLKTTNLIGDCEMKKTVVMAALIAALAFAGIQTVSANSDSNYGDSNYGPGYCANYFNGGNGYTAEDRAAFDKFRDDTAGIRKEIVVKQNELTALMNRDNPDETKVAKLTGELYDLQATLDSKAEAAGIGNGFAYGHGPGMMGGYGWGPGMMQGYGMGPGMMRGYGWGPGRHMMNW